MWQAYKPGVTIIGKQVRVAGPPGNYVGVTNVANGLPARVTSGLVGSCALINHEFAKVSFRRTEGSNFSLWPKCTGLTHDNVVLGLMNVYVAISNLRGFEVGGNIPPQ